MKQMDGSSSPGNSKAVLWSEFGKGLWCEEQMEASIPWFLSVACHRARSCCCHSANKDKPGCCCLLHTDLRCLTFDMKKSWSKESQMDFPHLVWAG